MSKRDSHAGKPYYQKEAYARYLLEEDYEPTLDDSLQFDNTGKAGEDLTESTIKRKRSINIKYNFMEHLREHWFKYILSGLVIIGVYLVFDSRYEFKLIDYKLSVITKSVDKIDQKIESHGKNIIENNIKIEAIEKQIK